jgi:hypothetical protein
VAPDEEDDPVVEPDVAVPSRGIPPECERFGVALEKLAKCGVLPAETRTALINATKQLRKSFSQKLNAAARAQLVGQCEMQATNYENMLSQMGCGSP